MKNSQLRPSISVVIATYKRAKMVREAVLAAWNQTLRPDEIIVSDDCSPDDTLYVLEALKAEVPILKIISTPANSGGVPNWNHVIENSTGELIAWCSDDDRFKPDHLNKSVTYLTEHPEVGLVHAGFEEVFDGADLEQQNRYIPLKSNKEFIVDRSNAVEYFSENFSWYFHPSTLVFRRTLWNRVGVFDKKYALADTDWFLRATVEHRTVYLPYYGVINRRHSGGSGNWSARVGSINMQRELYFSVTNFMDCVRKSNPPVDNLDQQFSRWLWKYRILLLRIFISRSRAGRIDVAKDCAEEIRHVSPFLHFIPQVLFALTIILAFHALSLLQSILPGGRSKYADLGKYIPM